MHKPRRSSRLRSTAWIAAVWLVGGVVMTVASAWAFAWWPGNIAIQWSGMFWENERAGPNNVIAPHWSADSRWNRQIVIWHSQAPSDKVMAKPGNSDSIRFKVEDRPLPRWLTTSRLFSYAEHAPPSWYYTYVYGWPRLSMSYTNDLQTTSPRLHGAIDLRSASNRRIEDILPLHIHWEGFLVNTLCLGAPLAGLWIGVGALRRRLRSRRGGCPRCGYALDGLTSGVCPECGREQRRRKD